MVARIIVVSNDVIPGVGVPVGAPGLRAWGIAAGLRGCGFEVILTAPEEIVARAWNRARGNIVAPTPSGSTILPDSALPRFIKTHAPAVVVMTNSNRMGGLRRERGVKVVYDFFAPKMLELALRTSPCPTQRSLAELRQQKIHGINLSDVFVVNGAKKLPYVYGWLLQGDRPITEMPVAVVNMPSEPAFGERRPNGSRLSIVAPGYHQQWVRLGTAPEALKRALDDIPDLHLTVVGQSRWEGWSHPEGDALKLLVEHPSCTAVGHMLFEDFREMLGTKDVFVDLFEQTLERQLAMVTRTVIAISCGLPVIHPSFTEVSPLIAAYDAGWLVDVSDSEALVTLLVRIASDPAELAEKRANARRLAQEVFAPREAVKPLVQVVNELY